MKCPVYEMSCLWNVLSMKCPVYEMSCKWNVFSTVCRVYMKCLWWKNTVFVCLESCLKILSYLSFTKWYGKDFVQSSQSPKGIESLPQTMIFNLISSTTQCCRPLIFQTINSDGSNNQSLKYQRFTPSCFRDIGIRKLGFVAKTQFL